MQIVSKIDSLHEMSNFVFWENRKKNFIKLSSAELAERVIKSNMALLHCLKGLVVLNCVYKNFNVDT